MILAALIDWKLKIVSERRKLRNFSFSVFHCPSLKLGCDWDFGGKIKTDSLKEPPSINNVIFLFYSLIVGNE